MLERECGFLQMNIDQKDGRKRIVEIGDGQVSGLVGWNAAHFATLWAD
jgi:hypothetical protein